MFSPDFQHGAEASFIVFLETKLQYISNPSLELAVASTRRGPLLQVCTIMLSLETLLMGVV